MLTHADAAEDFRAAAIRRLGQFTAVIPGTDAELRAGVVSAIIHGVLMERYLLRLGPLADAGSCSGSSPTSVPSGRTLTSSLLISSVRSHDWLASPVVALEAHLHHELVEPLRQVERSRVPIRAAGPAGGVRGGRDEDHPAGQGRGGHRHRRDGLASTLLRGASASDSHFSIGAVRSPPDLPCLLRCHPDLSL
ncbi:hypothetical protein [Nonomuraea sp. NPDC049625]|uniref:TetR/AcrR family transcriptional regulator n=1 Tax=Nonomuraea sp. NPDC049625 TaxID=3155775 RepID=UPI00343A9C27